MRRPEELSWKVETAPDRIPLQFQFPPFMRHVEEATTPPPVQSASLCPCQYRERKFVNELVYLAFNIIPVYGVCYLADALVINSIEFWSGSNPMASIGDVKKVKGENGDYLVETLENGYSITKEGETASMELIYNKELNTWNVVADGVSTELLQMNDDGTAQMTLPNGEEMTVTLDAQGVAAARQATMIGTYYAFN